MPDNLPGNAVTAFSPINHQVCGGKNIPSCDTKHAFFHLWHPNPPVLLQKDRGLRCVKIIMAKGSPQFIFDLCKEYTPVLGHLFFYLAHCMIHKGIFTWPFCDVEMGLIHVRNASKSAARFIKSVPKIRVDFRGEFCAGSMMDFPRRNCIFALYYTIMQKLYDRV